MYHPGFPWLLQLLVPWLPARSQPRRRSRAAFAVTGAKLGSTWQLVFDREPYWTGSLWRRDKAKANCNEGLQWNGVKMFDSAHVQNKKSMKVKFGIECQHVPVPDHAVAPTHSRSTAPASPASFCKQSCCYLWRWHPKYERRSHYTTRANSWPA